MFILGISPISSINVAASFVVIDVINLTIGGIILSKVTHMPIAFTVWSTIDIFAYTFRILITPGKDSRTRQVSIALKGSDILEKTKPLWDKAQDYVREYLGQESLSDLSHFSISLRV